MGNTFDIGSGVGALIGALGIGNNRQDKRQVEQAGKLSRIQVEGGKEMSEFQKGQDLQFWKDTNYPAQVEMMKAAGLNPALMYGSAGSGGQTGSGGGGMPSTGSAADAASTQNSNMGMGMQLAQLSMMDAQTKKIEAETKNLESGVPVNETKADGQKLDNINKGLQNDILSATKDDTIDKIESEAKNALIKLEHDTIKKVIDENTARSQEERIKREAIGKMLDNQLTAGKINLNNQQINEIITTLKQKQEAIDISRNVQEQNKANQEALIELGKIGLGIQGARAVMEGLKGISSRRVGGVRRTEYDRDDKGRVIEQRNYNNEQ